MDIQWPRIIWAGSISKGWEWRRVMQQAMKWYLRAASEGVFAPAQNNVGYMYETAGCG